MGWKAAVEADAIARGAAVEVDAIGEQLSGRNWGAAAEADAIGEQQPQLWSSN